MKTLQEPMGFSTFISLLAALEENYELLSAANYSVKKREQRMKENTRIMRSITRKQDESPAHPASGDDGHHPWAA